MSHSTHDSKGTAHHSRADQGGRDESAEEVEAKGKQNEIAAGEKPSPRTDAGMGLTKNPSWDAAIGAYVDRSGLTPNTIRTVRTTLRAFARDHIPKDVEGPAGVGRELAYAYIYRDSIAQAYRLSLYSRLNAFYAWLVEVGAIDENENPMDAVERPEAPSTERPYLTPAELSRLIEAIRKDYRDRSVASGQGSIQEGDLIWVVPPLQFGAGTGLRPAVLKTLRVGDVRFEEALLHVSALDDESGTDREIPLCPMALEAAEEAAKGKSETDYLFSGARSEQIDTRRLTRTVKRYLRETGIAPEFSFTDCTRHTCASWLTILGYPITDVARMLGYSSLRSVEPYQRLAPSMDNLLGGVSAHHEDFAEAAEAIGFFPSVMKR
jgi:integrase